MTNPETQLDFVFRTDLSNTIDSFQQARPDLAEAWTLIRTAYDLPSNLARPNVWIVDTQPQQPIPHARRLR